MAQFKSSAFNRGGSWQSDGLDAADQYNRSRQDQSSDDDFRRQLALAQLQSADNRFGVERQDRANADAAQYGFMGKQMDQNALFRSQDREDNAAERTARLGYQTGRDDKMDARYQQNWDVAQEDRNSMKPLRDAQLKREIAMGTLGDMDIADRVAQRGRANVAQSAPGAAYSPRTQAGRDMADRSAMTGELPGLSGIDVRAADRQAVAEGLGSAEEGMIEDLGALRKKEDAWFSSPEQSDIQPVVQQLQKLIKDYEFTGMPHDEAVRKAKSIITKNYPEVTHYIRNLGFATPFVGASAANALTAGPSARDTLLQALRMTK